jgi:hypothetical protein
MPDYRQQNGQICETILTEHLLREGYYVMRPMAAHGPIDVVAYSEEGDIYLLDAKKDAKRVNPKRKTPTRIYRVVKKGAQEQLGVRIAYVDIDTRDVHIVPPLGE